MKLTIIPIVIGAFDTITKGLLKGLEDLEAGGRVETLQKTGITENGQNTEKRPGDLRRLTVTQTPVKSHQLMVSVKNSKGVNNNNNEQVIYAQTGIRP